MRSARTFALHCLLVTACSDSTPATQDAGTQDRDASTGTVDAGAQDGNIPATHGDASLRDALVDVAEPDAGPVLADEFGCLPQSVDVFNVVDAYGTNPEYPLWFGLERIADGWGIDVRGATLVTPTLMVVDAAREYQMWYPFQVRSGPSDVCVAGGDFLGRLDLQIGWHDSKANNSAAVLWFTPNTTLTGAYIFNNHDSIRPTRRTTTSENYRIEHTWVAYNRDDCIENDAPTGSGTVYDSLFDGCFVGFSTRNTGTTSRVDQTVTLDRVLMRLEPQPFPYRWWVRLQSTNIYFDAFELTDGTVYENHGYTTTNIPFNHGPLFKHNGGVDTDPRFAIRNSVFLFQEIPHHGFVDFPPESIVTECTHNTVVWAGRAPVEDFLAVFDAPPGCVTVTEDLSVWQDAVADWHARHPNVGAAYKPEIMGDIRIPRWDPQPW